MIIARAYYNVGNTTSSVYTYNVRALIPGDLNGDGVVNARDLSIRSGNWLNHT